MSDRQDGLRDSPRDVLIVGAGFAGMYAIHRFRQQGLSVLALEAGSDVGGTWYWNRYPGARCDVPSLEYSYGFSEALEQEWDWPEVFSAQPDILRYANHVADRFDLRRDIRFDTRVTAVTYQEAENLWQLTTETGETFERADTASWPPAAFPFRTRRTFPARIPSPARCCIRVCGRRSPSISPASGSASSAPAPPACRPFPSWPARPAPHRVPAHAGLHGAGQPQGHARRGAGRFPNALSADPGDAAEQRRRRVRLPTGKEQARCSAGADEQALSPSRPPVAEPVAPAGGGMTAFSTSAPRQRSASWSKRTRSRRAVVLPRCLRISEAANEAANAAVPGGHPRPGRRPGDSGAFSVPRPMASAASARCWTATTTRPSTATTSRWWT